jgi:hypothetical protein
MKNIDHKIETLSPAQMMSLNDRFSKIQEYL